MAAHTTLGTDGHPLRVMGNEMYIRLTGKDTGGSYSIMEHVMPPGGGAPFLHTHPAQETFCVREGTFELYSKGVKGKETTTAQAGDVHHVNSNIPHGVKNVGKEPGRVFIVFHPADLQEKFFFEFHELLEKHPGPPDMAKLAPLFQKHKLVLLETPEGL